jgi:hypothetical protein
MGGRMSRTKGAGYEREVAGELQGWLGAVVTRRLGQARDGGHDLELPGFTVECKRRAGFIGHAWMAQAVAASVGNGGLPPVVFARGDRHETIVMMRLADWVEIAREVIVDSEGSRRPQEASAGGGVGEGSGGGQAAPSAGYNRGQCQGSPDGAEGDGEVREL